MSLLLSQRHACCDKVARVPELGASLLLSACMPYLASTMCCTCPPCCDIMCRVLPCKGLLQHHDIALTVAQPPVRIHNSTVYVVIAAVNSNSLIPSCHQVPQSLAITGLSCIKWELSLPVQEQACLTSAFACCVVSRLCIA